MLPLGSSLPQVDDVGDKAGEEETSLSAESYLDNIHSSFSGALQISDEDCVPFGFDSKKTLEESYRDCIGDNGENRVVQCIEQGILLYKMALAMERYKHNVGDCSYGDYSFCEIMFCRAVDLYLQKKLLLLLKKLVPDAKIRQKPLSSMDSLTLGMYPRLFDEKVGHTGKKFTEAFTCCCAGDESKVLQGDAPLSELWWRRLGTTIENYSSSRNSAAHAGRGEINDFEHLARSLVYLFEGYVWEAEKDDKRVPILSQGNAFKMAESGLKKAFDNGVGTHHVHEKCEPRKCCDECVVAPRPSLDGPGASLEQASLPTVAPIWVEKEEPKVLSKWISEWKESGRKLGRFTSARAVNRLLESEGLLEKKEEKGFSFSTTLEEMGCFEEERDTYQAMKYSSVAAEFVYEVIGRHLE